MKNLTLKRLAWALTALILISILAGYGIALSNDPDLLVYQQDISGALYPYIAATTVGAYLVLANLIIYRNPRHTIGWLFLTIGFFLGFQFFGLALEILSVPGYSRLISIVVALSGDLWIPSFFIPVTLVLQYFPDGRLPSPRWWPAALFTILGILLLYAGYTLHPWPWPENNVTQCCNPLALGAGDEFYDALNFLSSIFLLLGILGSFASVIARFRRSLGIERAQMKWLVYTAGASVSVLVLIGFLGYSDTPLFGLMFLLIPVVLAGAISIAILRHRLFDIDIIIRRTLQYAILTAILALVYFGGVVLLQNIFDTLAGQHESPLITVISTLAIAALFNPLRARIQDFIDRRFYRRKYDAERTLARFASTARDEVDLDALAGAILRAVEESLHPEWTALSLRMEISRNKL